jgi:ketosteroid isomerase-like protein
LPGIGTALRAAALAGCVSAGAAGCGGSPASHLSPVLPAPSAAGSTAAPGDSRALILDAYAGMWRVYAVAARTADYQPGALSQYAAGDALMILTRSLYDDYQDGVELRGAPALNPQVTAMTPAADPDSSSVTDCADDSRWLQYTTSGKPAGGAPAGRHRIYARLQLFGSAWKVTTVVVEKAGTC